MGYPLFVRRNQGVVKIPERLVIGSLSYWMERISTITQECVICGSVYVDERKLGDLDHSITQPRVNPTEERVGKDKDVENLDLPNPAEFNNNVTIPPGVVDLTLVRCSLLYLFQQLTCAVEHFIRKSASDAWQLAVSTCIRYSSHCPLMCAQSTEFTINTLIRASTSHSTFHVLDCGYSH